MEFYEMKSHADSGLVPTSWYYAFTIQALIWQSWKNICGCITTNDVRIAPLVHNSKAPRHVKPSLLQFI